MGLWGLAARFVRRERSIEGEVAPLPLLSQAAGASAEAVLQIEGLAKHFGGLKALDGVDIAVRRGTVHALIGPNGSGKSTFINVLTGLYRPTAGRITFAGRDITGLPPHQRTRAGLARTFQNIRVFRGMTVLENVMVGAERPGNDVAGQPGPVVERALPHSSSSAAGRTRCAPWASSPTATSAMWRSPVRWPATPSCCCWTSRPPG